MALTEIHFKSETLNLTLGMNLILPEHPQAWDSPPAVLYLLHGLSGNHTSWIRKTSIERYAKDYPLVIVMPEVHNSFYCDMAHGSNYWKFIAEEVPSLVKKWFHISNDWKKTFVAGLSMGGYGAMKLALSYPQNYAAAASLSGALDIANHANDDFAQSQLRTFEAIFGEMNTLPNSENDLIQKFQSFGKIPETKFYTCVGTEDYLYQDTLTFNQHAKAKGFDLTSEEAPGAHEWSFWDTYIQRVLEWLPIQPLESEPTQ